MKPKVLILEVVIHKFATENKESKEDKETELNKNLNITKGDETKGVDTGSGDL